MNFASGTYAISTVICLPVGLVYYFLLFHWLPCWSHIILAPIAAFAAVITMFVLVVGGWIGWMWFKENHL